MQPGITPPRETIIDLVKGYLRSPESSWSNGISGAIAEFMYDAGETIRFGETDNSLHAVTDRGAITVRLPEELTCFAYEEISHCTRSWTQTIALALPDAYSRISVNQVITALGADREAVRPRDRRKQLFDLGLGSDQARFCVRSGDPGLVKELNSLCGQALADNMHTIAGFLQSASPQRVVISALGRIEVCTPIPQQGGATEAGPHTHLLPYLLGKNKAVTPPGYSAVMHVYPPHPTHDKYGAEKPFDRARYDAFQDVLEKVGIEDYRKAKISAAEMSGADPANDSLWYDIARRVVDIQSAFLCSRTG